eukprot:3362682-Rhodomonas_salina.1
MKHRFGYDDALDAFGIHAPGLSPCPLSYPAPSTVPDCVLFRPSTLRRVRAYALSVSGLVSTEVVPLSGTHPPQARIRPPTASCSVLEHYAMSGTDVAGGSTMRCSTVLWKCYSYCAAHLSGTDAGYGGTRGGTWRHSNGAAGYRRCFKRSERRVLWRAASALLPCRQPCRQSVLDICYAMSGTGLAYAANVMEPPT